MKKIRQVQYVIQPEWVADDGDELTPLPTNPTVVPAKQLAAWVAETLPAEIARLEAEINGGE